MRHRRTTLALLIVLVVPVAGQAQDPSALSPDLNNPMPHCGPLMDGQVFCKFGIIYECELISPNSLERRTGWRWKADILRGCAGPSPPRADQQNVLPPEITYAPQQSNLPGIQPGTGCSTAPGGRPQDGTMYIRPTGCQGHGPPRQPQ